MAEILGASGRARWRGAATAISAVLFAMALVPSVAFGESDEERAYNLYLEAGGAYQSADFERAANLLEEAYQTFGLPVILIKLAETYEKLGRLEDAVQTYRRVGPSKDEKKRERLNKAIRTLEAALEKPVQVYVSSTVPGVQARVDGSSVSLPATLELARDMHTFEVTKPGYEPLEKRIQVEGAGLQLVELAPQPLLGDVTIKSGDDDFSDTNLFVNGEPVVLSDEERRLGIAPNRPVPEGAHSLLCATEDDSPRAVAFRVRQGRSTEVSCGDAGVAASSGGGGGSDHTWAWVATTGAVAAVAIGSFLLIDYQDDLDRDSGDPGVRISSSSKPLAGGILLGVGGALAITSGLLFADVFGGGDDGGSTTALSASPIPGGAATYIGGTF